MFVRTETFVTLGYNRRAHKLCENTGWEISSMSNTYKPDARLAEAAREIYRTYGTDIQRYFTDLLGPMEDKTCERPSECVGAESSSRVVDGRKNGKST